MVSTAATIDPMAEIEVPMAVLTQALGRKQVLRHMLAMARTAQMGTPASEVRLA